VKRSGPAASCTTSSRTGSASRARFVSQSLGRWAVSVPTLVVSNYQKQVIHADLTQNVLIDGDDVPAIIDFSPHFRPTGYAIHGRREASPLSSRGPAPGGNEVLF
jgi:hypothetical protein